MDYRARKWYFRRESDNVLKMSKLVMVLFENWNLLKKQYSATIKTYDFWDKWNHQNTLGLDVSMAKSDY